MGQVEQDEIDQDREQDREECVDGDTLYDIRVDFDDAAKYAQNEWNTSLEQSTIEEEQGKDDDQWAGQGTDEEGYEYDEKNYDQLQGEFGG